MVNSNQMLNCGILELDTLSDEKLARVREFVKQNLGRPGSSSSCKTVGGSSSKQAGGSSNNSSSSSSETSSPQQQGRLTKVS